MLNKKHVIIEKRNIYVLLLNEYSLHMIVTIIHWVPILNRICFMDIQFGLLDGYSKMYNDKKNMNLLFLIEYSFYQLC